MLGGCCAIVAPPVKKTDPHRKSDMPVDSADSTSVTQIMGWNEDCGCGLLDACPARELAAAAGTRPKLAWAEEPGAAALRWVLRGPTTFLIPYTPARHMAVVWVSTRRGSQRGRTFFF
jgi:hypothetical protein